MNAALIPVGKAALFFLIAFSASPLVRQAYRWNDCVDHVSESLNSHEEDRGRGNAEAVVTCNGSGRARGWRGLTQ